MLTIALLADIIVDHPEAVKWLLGAMFTLIVFMISSGWALISRKIGKLESADAALAYRVGNVESAIGKYEEHVGAGDKELKSLSDRVSTHMEKEETHVWGGIASLKEQLNEMQLENIQAHSEIVNSFSPRLATIETKVATIEKKMPNGELNEVIGLLRSLVRAKP